LKPARQAGRCPTSKYKDVEIFFNLDAEKRYVQAGEDEKKGKRLMV
jgi:hypothetical protein